MSEEQSIEKRSVQNDSTEDLDSTVRNEAVIAKQEKWSGPLPPPAILAQFDDIVEGGAERVFKQFEEQSEHRKKMELECFRKGHFEAVLGKIFAFVFVISCLCLAAFAVYMGKEVVGSLMGTGVMGVVAATFIYQKKRDFNDSD